MDFDPHTHSTFSDGKNTLEENILAGVGKGLKKIALTDHAYLHMAYGVSMRRLDEYLKEAYELKKAYNRDIEVLVGMEFNLLDTEGNIDIPLGYADEFELKLIGVHKLTKYSNFKSIVYMMGYQLFDKIRYSRKVLDINTKSYIAAIENNDIDIVAHPSNIARVDFKALAETCERTNTLLEINARHPDLRKGDVEKVLETKANFILGSDSHRAESIGECGYGSRFIEENSIPLNRVVNAFDA